MEADMARAEITGRKQCVTAGRAKRRAGPPQAKPAETAEAHDNDGNDGNDDDDAPNRDAEHEPTPHGEPKSGAPNKLPPIRGPPIPAAAFSIREFCVAHRLSESMYFKLRAQGLGPDEMIIGSRRIISYEAAARWRREREAATAE
jgi:hypothetical protein